MVVAKCGKDFKTDSSALVDGYRWRRTKEADQKVLVRFVRGENFSRLEIGLINRV